MENEQATDAVAPSPIAPHARGRAFLYALSAMYLLVDLWAAFVTYVDFSQADLFHECLLYTVLAVQLAQLGTLAGWTWMGSGDGRIRVPLCLLLIYVLDRSLSAQWGHVWSISMGLESTLHVTLIAMAIGRILGFKCQLRSLPLTTTKAAWQFSLYQLLTWTTITAIVLGGARLTALQPDVDVWGTLLIAILVASCVGLWFATFRWSAWFAVLLAMGLVGSAIAIQFQSPIPHQDTAPLVIIGVQSLLQIANITVLRKAGYELRYS